VIVDERTYSIAPGRLAEYLARHVAVALPIMRRHLGEPLAYYTTESPELNQFVHLWRYETLADRERRRAAMYADPEWLAYRHETGEQGWVLHQCNRLLRTFELPRSDAAKNDRGHVDDV
jgi:NIPSNAP protein